MRPHVSHAGGAPATTFSEAFDAETRDFGVGTSFLPGIDTTRTQGQALVCVKPPCDHGEYTALDSIENLVRITGGTNTDIGAGWSLLHCR